MLVEALPLVIKELSQYQQNLAQDTTTREAAQKEKPLTNLMLLLQQKIQSLEKPELKKLFWEMVRYAQGEEFEGKEVSKLFSSVGKPDFPLNFQQRMDLVRLLVREDIKQITKRLDPEPDNRQQRGFRR